MFPFPLRIPRGQRVTVTQKFKSQELLDFYASKGIKMQFHDAIDVAVGDTKQTHGVPFVCPFPIGDCIYFDDSGETGTPKADRVQIKYVKDGNEYILGGLHFSKMLKQDTYVKGETIAYLGNSGFVNPEPSKTNPLAGSHLHMSLRVNGVVVDPELYFDVNNPFWGDDTGDAFDVNELTPKGTIVPPKASESIALFAGTLTGWKRDTLLALVKYLQSLGY